MNFCEQLIVLKILYVIKRLLSLVTTVIPLLLIIFIMIDIFKAMIGDPDKLSKALEISIKRFISAIIIFFVPTIVFAVFGLFKNTETDLLCFNSATKENIEIAKINRQATIAKLREEEKNAAEELARKQEDQNRLMEAQRQLEQEKINNQESNVETSDNIVVPASSNRGSLTPIINGTQRALKEGDCLNWSDNCYCPNAGRLKGFQFIMNDSTSRTFKEVKGRESNTSIQETCSDGRTIKVTVNTLLKDNYQYALKQICLLTTTGINGVKLGSDAIHNKGTISSRLNSARTICSLHSYGAAIDINNSWTTEVNGQSYTPYGGQGTKTRTAYNNYVSAIGRESDTRNINYILWMYAFKPAGFTWGGTWSDANFDPMHYEVT